MSLFAVLAATDPSALDERISSIFAENQRRNLGSGQWIVVFDSIIPSDVYSFIEQNGGNIQCIIVPANIYYGWQDAAVWEWIEEAANA